MSEWVMIGVPASAGAHHAGQEVAPEALRAAGFAHRLYRAGIGVTDSATFPVPCSPPDGDGAIPSVAGERVPRLLPPWEAGYALHYGRSNQQDGFDGNV
jgi:hypothetical protein